MKLNNKIEHFLLGVALLCTANSGSALTLGKARGAVLLGQPLSLTFVLQYEQEEVFSDWCFEAEVYYGDARQEGGRVSISVVPAEVGTPTAVRVIAAAPVDEPVVTVYLRSTCGLKIARKYVLLSDLASDIVAPSANDAGSRSLSTPLVAVPRAVLPNRASPTKEKLEKPAILGPKVNKEATPSFQKSYGISPGVRNSGSHLKVSILDLMDVKNPDLRLSDNIATPVAEDLQKREEAKTLWRSFIPSAEDALRDENQQKAVAADLKGLRDISSKNQEDLLNLSKRLTQAEAERFANPLTYALSGVSVILLLLVIALFAKLRGNSANDTPWWRGSSKVDEDDEEEDVNLQDAKAHLEHSVVSSDSTPAKAATETSQNLRLLNGAQPLQNTDIDIDLDLGGPEVAEAPIASKSKPSNAVSGNSGYPRDFSHSLNASLHAINTQEMLDVRQQADFFMTLGQHEEAIGLLENSIRESEASNPLVYIDLLKVLHTLSRKPAFDHYRNEFNTIFTGWAPQYSVFGQPGNSLDAYPQICAEISQVWGTESASEFLEQCMVRSPEDAPEHYFDLDAFRDLLMLHAIAARIGPHSASDSSFMPFSAVRTVANPNPVAAQVSVPATAESVSSVNTTQELTAVAHPISNGSSSTASNLIDFDASEL